jgi:dienelactone hydrolase
MKTSPRLILFTGLLIGSIILGGCAQATATPTAALPTLAPLVPTGAASTQAPVEGFKTLIPAAQAFVDQMVKGDFAAATGRFDATMKTAMPEAKLKDAWQQLLGQVGAFQKQLSTRTEEQKGYRIVYVVCQFEKSVINVRVVYNAQEQIAGLFFQPGTAPGATPTPIPYNPPAYVNTASFHESDVTVGSGEWALPGTLTRPNGSGPFPAVVLVHGSGPNDRDETLGPNKPFRDLAWGLASQGVAVLRYDKRTLVHASQFTPEILAKLTLQEETIDDALLAAQLLRQTAAIDPKRVYVLGHSLGALAAPRIGQQDPALAGLIIMAGPTSPFEDLILYQITYLTGLNAAPTDQQKADIETLKTQVARVKDPNLSNQVDGKDLPLGITPTYWLNLRNYHPEYVAKSLEMPVFVLQGERDYQVPPATEFGPWKAALAQKANATLKLYPKLNHLFIAGEGQPTPQEYQLTGHVSEDVVKDIAQWVKK